MITWGGQQVQEGYSLWLWVPQSKLVDARNVAMHDKISDGSLLYNNTAQFHQNGSIFGSRVALGGQRGGLNQKYRQSEPAEEDLTLR